LSSQRWLPELAKIKKRDKLPKVMVGIEGSTAAGKSSLINALVDEENLLTANCMRASTAVAT